MIYIDYILNNNIIITVLVNGLGLLEQHGNFRAALATARELDARAAAVPSPGPPAQHQQAAGGPELRWPCHCGPQHRVGVSVRGRSLRMRRMREVGWEGGREGGREGSGWEGKSGRAVPGSRAAAERRRRQRWKMLLSSRAVPGSRATAERRRQWRRTRKLRRSSRASAKQQPLTT